RDFPVTGVQTCALPISGGRGVIVVAGEALVDLTPTAQGAGAHDDGGLEFTARPGGSPFNVAIGLGRLGTPVAFLGVLSGDAFGRSEERRAGTGCGRGVP